MKNNWIRKIVGGLSLTSVLFVFQACYGTPQDFSYDLYVEGLVKSETTGLPIAGVKVSVVDHMQYELTNEEGYFSFYTEREVSLKISVQDIDAEQNGAFEDKDIVITNAEERVFLNVDLQEK